MTYHRGTLSEFNTWHDAAKLAYGIPIGGIIGYVDGKPAPDNERTTAYVNAIHNPDNSDDYIWPYGAYPIDGRAQLSQSDFDNLNWFPEI
jgi:hypothetical protein